MNTYGPAFAAYSLANIENWKDRRQAIAFTAEKSGPFTATIFLKSDLAGQSKPGSYSGGDGGHVFITLREDCAGLPGEHILDYAVFDPGNPIGRSPDTQVLFLPSMFDCPLIAGQRYWLVIENTDPNSAANFVSVNTFSLQSAAHPLLIANPVVYSYMIAENNGPWVARPDHAPIFAITYADGTCSGQGYQDVAASSGPVQTSATNLVREVFTPTQDSTVHALYVFYNGQWNMLRFGPILQAGQPYVINVPSGVSVYPIIKAEGFPVTDNVFKDGYYATSANAGQSWMEYKTPLGVGNRDLPFYFVTS